MRSLTRVVGPTLAVLLCISAPAAAESPNDALLCPEDGAELRLDRLARSLSLHLRGRLPSAEELDALAERPPDATLPPEVVEAWLADPAFARQVVRRHRALFWPNIDRFRQELQQIGGPDGPWARRDQGAMYRHPGARLPERHYCVDQPAEFDEDGNIVTWQHPNRPRVWREGWVEVEPIWAPGTTIKVCAFDAQTTEITEDGVDCASAQGVAHAGCGCGPDLIRCLPDTNTGFGDLIGRSLERSFEKLLEQNILDDKPFIDVFTSRRLFVNGPLSHYYRYMTGWKTRDVGPAPIEPAAVPDLPFEARDTWAEAVQKPAHAGLLTHHVFLMRHQRNRARGAQVLEQLLCETLSPPAGGLPVATDESARDPDLQRRAGCKYCHAKLEPASSHWGRWQEVGVGHLDPERFPLFNEACFDCAQGRGICPVECSQYIMNPLVEKLEPYVGFLGKSVFLSEHHLENIDRGPGHLMQTAVADGRLPRCTAQRAAEWLLGRSLDQEGDPEWLDDIARDFVQDGMRYRRLVARIVTDPRYRRIR